MTKKKAAAKADGQAPDTTPQEPDVAEPQPEPREPDSEPAAPGPEPGPPAEEPAPAKPAPAAPEAAPLASPREDKVHPGVRLMTEPHAITAVMDERHLGIVDAAGKPVDVKAALVSNGPRSTAYRATRRIFEETTMPGTEQPRRRLLYGEGAIVSRGEYEALCAAVEARSGQEPASA